MSLRVYLDPADNLMIRDGRPFNQDDAGRAAAASRFPPPPDTLYGATRVALARALGWSGAGDWTAGEGGDERAKLLGTWADENAHLKVAGPYFEVAGTPLLPLPATLYACVLTGGDVRTIRNLEPGEAMETDCGLVRLLDFGAEVAGERDVPLVGRWGIEDAVRAGLAGGAWSAKALTPALPGPSTHRPRPLGLNRSAKLPGVAVEALGATEARIGLERVAETRQALEGRLYASTRRVLPPGVRMFVEVVGVGLEAGLLPAPVPLGGEGRFAFVEAAHATEARPKPIPGGTYLVMLTTPAILPALEIDKPIYGLPGRLAAAAVAGVAATAQFERPGPSKRQQTASVAVLPPGTVLFMTGGDGSPPPVAIGDRTWRGYGRFLTGVWNDG